MKRKLPEDDIIVFTEYDYRPLTIKSKIYTRFSSSRSRLQKNTPSWANLEKIKEAYEKCVLKEYETKVRHHVDHIIPINGENVCGLHVENNLQIITRKDNLLKRNLFDE